MSHSAVSGNCDRRLAELVEKYSSRLPQLSLPQITQICRQIIAHDYDKKSMTLSVGNKSVPLVVHRNVLQPMSSRLLADYISSNRGMFDDGIVFDIGTGTGIQAIAAAGAGAKYVVATDLYEAAVENAKENVLTLGLAHVIEVGQADCLDADVHKGEADVVILAHFYFGDDPIAEAPVTTGMLDKGSLVPRFLACVKRFLKPGGRIITMHWPFAGSMNDPLHHLSKHPEYKVEGIEKHRSTGTIQRGEINLITIRFRR